MRKEDELKAQATLLPIMIAALAASACATTHVDTGWDPKIDFSTYRTYAFPPTEDLEDQPLKVYVAVAVGERLEAAGFEPDPHDPDLTVVVYGSMSGHISFTQRIPWYQPDGGWNGWYTYGWAMGGPDVVMRNVPEGSIFVDLVDTEHKKLVWRGTAHKALTQDPDPDKAQGRVDDVLDRMFSGFPPSS